MCMNLCLTKRGETPFMLASRHARRDVMGLLIDSGADPNIPYKVSLDRVYMQCQYNIMYEFNII